MKLHTALKEKNKKIKKINSLINKVINNNSYLEANNPKYNSKELYASVIKELDDYVAFKAALFNSTAPIRQKIFKISELKNLSKQLMIMPCLEGLQNTNSYVPSSSMYKATIDEVEKDVLIQNIEDQISKLQEEIDTFNITTNLQEY